MPYQKRKKINEAAIDENLASICDELLKYNENATFIISKKFKEKKNGALGDEIFEHPVILSNIKVSDLEIPFAYRIINGNGLALWCDEYELAKIVFCNFKVDKDKLYIDDDVLNNTKNFH